jgi:integrase
MPAPPFTAPDAAKVDHFGLHGLRHRYCSLVVNIGAPVKEAQSRLGHASAMSVRAPPARKIPENHLMSG